MDAAQQTHLLDNLVATDYGWRGDIPVMAGTFLGRQVGLDIYTRSYPMKDPPPPISTDERSLALLILANLADVMSAAERQFAKYTAEIAGEGEHVAAPHVWLSRESLELDGPVRWSFVVERDDDPDFTYHIEFDGLKFLEIWAGD